MDNNENNKIEKPVAFLMIANGILLLSLTASTMSILLFEIAKKVFFN